MFRILSFNFLKVQVHEEMLHQRMKWMLKLFKKNRENLPEVIFITRDGISEGQYEMAMTMDLPSLRVSLLSNVN